MNPCACDQELCVCGHRRNKHSPRGTGDECNDVVCPCMKFTAKNPPISPDDFIAVQQECVRLKEVVAELTDNKEIWTRDCMDGSYTECLYCNERAYTLVKPISPIPHLDTCPVKRGAALVRER
jgi:hypothetical protein